MERRSTYTEDEISIARALLALRGIPFSTEFQTPPLQERYQASVIKRSRSPVAGASGTIKEVKDDHSAFVKKRSDDKTQQADTVEVLHNKEIKKVKKTRRTNSLLKSESPKTQQVESSGLLIRDSPDSPDDFSDSDSSFTEADYLRFLEQNQAKASRHRRRRRRDSSEDVGENYQNESKKIKHDFEDLTNNNDYFIKIEDCEPEDEWIGIGSGNTLVRRDKYKKINWDSFKLATRGLLVAVFNKKTLATHSLTGKRSPAFHDKPAKKCLDPAKIEDIVCEIINVYNIDERSVRNIITTKCADECKMLRMRYERLNGDEVDEIIISDSDDPEKNFSG